MIHTVALAHVRPQPWKNGGGTTREVLTWPASADWALRLSVAHIDRDGPFSPFPGISRWFAVLSGEGVELRWQDRTARVTPGSTPVHFDGGDAPGCRLLGGPTEDLNLMLRSGRARGALRPARSGQPSSTAPGWRGLYTCEACVLLAEGRYALPAHCLAWSDNAVGAWELDGSPDRRAWWIELEELCA